MNCRAKIGLFLFRKFFLLPLPQNKLHNLMKLSKEQKRILVCCILYLVATVAINLLVFVYGKHDWSGFWTMTESMAVGAIVVVLFLLIGSRIPKKKDEDKQ